MAEAVRVQTCIRTAPNPASGGENSSLVGLLTLPGGAWYLGYDLTSEEARATWVPTTTTTSKRDPTATSVCLRVWNANLQTLNEAPDTKAQGEKPVLEKVVDVDEVTYPKFFRQKLNVELKEFLVFGFEGKGPALGEQEEKIDKVLPEKLSALQAELEKTRTQSATEISSLRAELSAEKARAQREFDAEKARLQDEFKKAAKALEAKPVPEIPAEKSRDLEQRLAKTEKELAKAIKSKERFEKLWTEMRSAESTNREESLQAGKERDEVEKKAQQLRNELHASNQAQRGAKKAVEKQAKTIATLEAEKAGMSTELANLLQTVVPENKRLKGDVAFLQDTIQAAEKELEREVAKTLELKSTLARYVSDYQRQGQELQKVKNNLSHSEIARSQLEGENDRATARLAALESEAGKRQRQIHQLAQDVRAEKTEREVAANELDRLKELMRRELTDAERNIRDLHARIAGLEKRVGATTAERNELHKAKSELQDLVSRESAERQGIERNNDRLRAEINQLKLRVDDAEGRASVLKSTLSVAESKLESYDKILRDEGERHAKLFDDMRREKAQAAEAEGKLKIIESKTKSQISQLVRDLEDSRAEAQRLSDAYNGAKTELEAAVQKLSSSDTQSEKGARELKAATEKIQKLEAELEKAFHRWLDYDKDHLYEQLDIEREASRLCAEGLQTEKNEHTASVGRLESEVQRLVREIGARDQWISEHAHAIVDLKRELQQERDLKAAFKSPTNSQGPEKNQRGGTAAGNVADEHARTIIANLERELQQQRELIAALRSRPEGLEHQQRTDELARTIAGLERELQKQRDQIASLKRSKSSQGNNTSSSDSEKQQEQQRTDEHATTIAFLEREILQQRDLKATLEQKSQTLEKQLSTEHEKLLQIERLLNSETSRHADTRRALDYANSQLSQQLSKLRAAHDSLEDQTTRSVQARSELSCRSEEVQQLRLAVANQKARVRALEKTSKHEDCVTKDSVEQVIGSYERLFDSVLKRSRGKRASAHNSYKAHYPGGFGFKNGKYHIVFRDAWY